MKALVTGASGFIGSHLAEQLLRQGHSVRVLLRKTSSTEWLKDLPLEITYGDLFQTDALREAVAGVDYVYHSAGLTKAKTAEEYFRANVDGTKNLLNAVRLHAPGLKRFVHISSQAAAGPSPSRTPINETVVPKPLTTYGRSKWASEQECHKLFGEIPITIVRPPVVYGPRDKDVFEFFHTVNRRLQPIVGFSEKYVSLVYVSDLIRGFILAAESPKGVGETYFVSSTTSYGWKEIGDTASRILGKRVLRIRIPAPLVYVVAGVAELFAVFSRKPALVNFEKAHDMVQDYWTCDSSKITRDCGYLQEVNLEEGITRTVEWYRREGWIE